MGRQKKGHNWKSRAIVRGELDDKETVKLQSLVDPSLLIENGAKDSNAPVLPSKKRDFRRAKDASESKKLLSKRKRKLLEKIVDRKKKKLEREGLVEKLKQVQIPEEELRGLISISQVQTKGLKRQFAEEEKIRFVESRGEDVSLVTALKPKKPRGSPCSLTSSNPNVLGFDESSSDEESDESHSDIEVNEGLPENNVNNSVVEEPQTNDLLKHNEKSSIGKTISPSTNMDVDIPKNADKLTDSPNDKTRNGPPKRLTTYIPVYRLPEIQSSRDRLPIISEEQIIMEAVADNPVLILAGETGSGKTTQVPQFLYEGGYASSGKMIGITEPRRVAAVSMSKRVAHEMNLDYGDEVGYQIRFEGNTTENTKIKFMTDGVLLREIEKDFLLSRYSVIILDEAHERSVFTDILIGLLSRIIPKRNSGQDPLRLIIMSATLRIEDFTVNKRLFKVSPPVIKVESRQYDVTAHFNKKTEENYVKAAIKKVSKIHTTLPEGGILVFVTGQKEVNQIVKHLRGIFSANSSNKGELDLESDEENEEKELKAALSHLKSKNKSSKGTDKKFKKPRDLLPSINLEDFRVMPLEDNETDALECLEMEEKISDIEDEDCARNNLSQPLWVLPLYSLLSSDRQAKVFEPPPEGHRLCVVSTNIAETSLTIPGIKYVVDTGKVKTKFYDKVTGVSTYHITWVSKAQANQRAGRAGRTSAGHCYRLYSSAVYENEFVDHAEPEILKRPVEDLVLQMKAMRMENIINFPFPTPPDPVQIQIAEKKLILLGALEVQNNVSFAEMQKNKFKAKITKLGKVISAFPIAPKFGKMLALSHQHDLLPYTITLVAALSVQEVLLETPIGDANDFKTSKFDKVKISEIRREWAGKGNSYLLGDPMVLIRAVGAAEYAKCTPEFCGRYGLRLKAMLEIRKLRRQLTNEINVILPDQNLILDPNLSPPSDEASKFLRQIILAGLPDQVASKIHKEGKEWKFAYRFGALEQPVYIHHSSVMRSLIPEWVCFQEIFEIDSKMYMRGLTVIDPEWLPIYANSQ